MVLNKMKNKHVVIEGILIVALIIVGIYAVLQTLQLREEQESLPKLTTITGEFNTTKGGMGIVNGTLLPYFTNKENETAQYTGKTVEVKGVIYDPEYPSDIITQEFAGPHMAIESIRILEE